MSPDRCPWYIAGPLLGMLIVALRALVNKPFGALGGYIDIADSATTRRRPGFRAFLLLGLVLGGGLYAVTLGSTAIAAAYPALGDGLIPTSAPVQLASLLIAGVLMGFGARTTGGCTSGHGLSGMSLGSPASIVSAMTFFGTAVVLAHVFSWAGTP